MTKDPCEAEVFYSAVPHQQAITSEPIAQAMPLDHQPNEARANDEQILAAVKSALHHTGYAQLRSVTSYCHHGRVILQGRIATRYLKQMAQEIVHKVAHVKEVDNDLHVICG